MVFKRFWLTCWAGKRVRLKRKRRTWMRTVMKSAPGRMPEDASCHQNDDDMYRKLDGTAIGSDHAGRVPTSSRLSERGIWVKSSPKRNEVNQWKQWRSAMPLQSMKIWAKPTEVATAPYTDTRCPPVIYSNTYWPAPTLLTVFQEKWLKSRNELSAIVEHHY